ncbi:hypothetical protein [Mycoplasma sp. HU2014]|uniref:hypothetical protein n=1 Tax=Mycoplasma sp. HU2014 TaxID=1664275 RepID=UPI00128E2566|nr:hypothetical protein [Mycoplasma sp. HU2014]
MEKIKIIFSKSINVLKKVNNKFHHHIDKLENRSNNILSMIGFVLDIASKILDVIISLNNYNDQRIYERLIKSL